MPLYTHHIRNESECVEIGKENDTHRKKSLDSKEVLNENVDAEEAAAATQTRQKKSNYFLM